MHFSYNPKNLILVKNNFFSKKLNEVNIKVFVLL